MAAFDEATWLGTGQTYKNVSPAIKLAANNALALPSTIRTEILPAITIRELCTLPIPTFQTKTSLTDELLQGFFSTCEPTTLSAESITKLRYLTMPERSAVFQIYDLAHQAWLDGKKSICYAHLDTAGNPTATRFPLFIATLWKESADLFTYRARWTKLSEYVTKQINQNKHAEQARTAKEAWECMNRLP
ncbi:hypothetical protein BDZ89DRAFT_1149681 [Hymenopellis radicata]|nr:hypothetical protein BDZ89DRAFT_1149681 [Hymenopellis radicata]